jgi:Trypsin-like peptidase domain/Effector-associated domain 1
MADIDLKPLPKLGKEILEEITEAIVNAYDIDDLSRVLRFKWGFVLANYIDTRKGLYYVVGDLVDWTERKGKTRELLALAFSQAAGNENLQKVAAKCGLPLALVEQKYKRDDAAPRPTSLEAMVNAHSRLIDFERFLARLQDVGEQVCLVETPVKKGTGFLVAPDCVLTNFHVVEEVIANMGLADNVICRFDFRTGENAQAAMVLKQYKLGAEPILAKSPYGQSDLTGTGEPGANELDYAILRLAESVGLGRNEKPRGWFTLAADTPVVALHDFVLIPQHAEGHALSVAWGSVVSFPAAGNRLRYDVTTRPGSSGAPCFTADLEIVGLHHAAEAKANPTYNQAVPLWLIARDLDSKSIKLVKP